MTDYSVATNADVQDLAQPNGLVARCGTCKAIMKGGCAGMTFASALALVVGRSMVFSLKDIMCLGAPGGTWQGQRMPFCRNATRVVGMVCALIGITPECNVFCEGIRMISVKNKYQDWQVYT